jgi:hypothetical protein
MLILSGSAAGDPAEMLSLWPAYFTRSEGVLPETRRFARGIAESVKNGVKRGPELFFPAQASGKNNSGPVFNSYVNS